MSTQLISIIVAVVALVGTIGNASLTIWERRHAERRKRYHAMADVVAKYRDPLHLAAEDLAMKIMNIVDNDFTWWFSEAAGRARQEYAMLHTAYTFGRFFGWLYILRRDTQFLLPSTRYDASSRVVRTSFSNIRMILRTSRDKSLFTILTGEQEAIGELMTVMDDITPDAEAEKSGGGVGSPVGGQCRCMGYASFVQRWKRDPEFRGWFNPIVNGLKEMSRVKSARTGARLSQSPDERLRRLQHQLVDLIECLDPRGLHSQPIRRCMAPARGCLCKACEGKEQELPSYGVQPKEKIVRGNSTFEVV